MKTFYTSLLVVVVLITALSPLVLHASSLLVFCNEGRPDANGQFQGGQCGWPELVRLAKNLIQFIILLAIPAAAVTIAWAGFTILTASGDSAKISEAKTMLGKVLWGLFWVLAAWLVVNVILSYLLVDNSYSIIRSS